MHNHVNEHHLKRVNENRVGLKPIVVYCVSWTAEHFNQRSQGCWQYLHDKQYFPVKRVKLLKTSALSCEQQERWAKRGFENRGTNTP